MAVDAALEEINFSPQSDVESTTVPTISPPKASFERPRLPPPNPAIDRPQPSSSRAPPSAQLSQSDIRRFLSTTSTLRPQQQQHSAMGARSRMPQFAYLQVGIELFAISLK